MTKPHTFLFLLFLTFTFSSCSKDDDDLKVQNELIFDGEVHPIKSGKLINYVDSNPIYTYEIQLNSSELDEDESPIDPIFNQFYFHTMSDGSSSQVNGVIGSSLMVFHAEPGSNANLEAYNVTQGSVEVRYVDNIYTIRFEGTAVNTLDEEDDREIAFSGSYRGELVNNEDFR